MLAPLLLNRLDIGHTAPARRSLLILGSQGVGNAKPTASVRAIDFTDPTHAREIAYYDVESPNQGSFWAAYCYNGFIYGSDIPNGFDSFLFSGPQRAGAQRLDHLN